KEEALSAQRRKGAVPRVSVVSAVRRDMVRTVEEIGEIVPLERIEIEPKVAGRVQGLALREGDPVAKGQVIASIRNAELDAQVAEQEARLSEARARLAQARGGSRQVEVGADAGRQRDS
ncbi:MAG: biotin/lipoyl-binding protein, partial [Armatimonadaceae bacterium]